MEKTFFVSVCERECPCKGKVLIEKYVWLRGVFLLAIKSYLFGENLAFVSSTV